MCEPCAKNSPTVNEGGDESSQIVGGVLILAMILAVIGYLGSEGGDVSGAKSQSNSPKSEPAAVSATDSQTSLPHWCAQAQSQTEKTICGNSAVAALDIQMAERFYALKNQLNQGAANQLMQQQRDWLKIRDGCGSDIDCLMSEYQQRILDLG